MKEKNVKHVKIKSIKTRNRWRSKREKWFLQEDVETRAFSEEAPG